MLSLQDREWKEFKIEDLFTIEIGKSIDGNKVDLTNGHSAYITRKENNNGLDGFIDYDNSYMNTKQPVITIGNETAEPYVQVFPFFTGTKVNILTPKGNIGKYVLLFIAQSLKMHKIKYSYSFTINSTRLKKQTVLLPVNDDDMPDYAFMEEYIREREQKLVRQYIAHISNGILTIGGITPLDKKEWKGIKLLDYFSFAKGNQNNMADLISGNIPLISARNVNNGCKDFVSANMQKTSFAGNCLTINNDGDGGAGISYYHPYDMLLDTHVTALYPKIEITYEAMLFVSVCITIQREKFGHGYSLNNSRLSVFRVMLPVDDNGTPDWGYMEQYAKAEINHLKLQYLNTKRTAFV